jgi:hypothetical protein
MASTGAEREARRQYTNVRGVDSREPQPERELDLPHRRVGQQARGRPCVARADGDVALAKTRRTTCMSSHTSF